MATSLNVIDPQAMVLDLQELISPWAFPEKHKVQKTQTVPVGLGYRCTVVSMATYPSFLLRSSVLRRLKWQPLWHKWFSQQADLWTRVRPVYLLATHQPYSLIAFFLNTWKLCIGESGFTSSGSKESPNPPKRILPNCCLTAWCIHRRHKN